MEELLNFALTYGWQIALIAFVGIVGLGAMKYANAFSKVDKKYRPLIYLAISVGFSVVATIIYLLIIEQFNFGYVVAVSGAIYGLNQTMYAIYETTKLRDLVVKILDFIKPYLVKLFNKNRKG